MGTLETLDLILRAATFALACAAAVAILLRRERHAASGYAAFAVAGIGAFMVASAPGAYATLGIAAFAFNAWCLSTPVAVYLLARTLFTEEDRPSAPLIAAAGMLVALTMAGDYGRFHIGPLGEEPHIALGLLIAGRAVSVALLALACAHAIAHWRADLVEQRRRVRAAFVAVIGSVFVVSASSELFFGGHGTPLGILVYAHGALLALAFALLQFVARGGIEALMPTPQPRAAAPAALALVRADAAEAALARRVTDAMAGERLWKREGLGIAELARALGTQEYLLRRAINRHLGYRNFNDFLHEHRLREAGERLARLEEAHLPVLTIALDCGYGSIGPFNRAFKARFGVTPTQFRNDHLVSARVGMKQENA
jgi:AraC-like DNA-binding protein